MNSKNSVIPLARRLLESVETLESNSPGSHDTGISQSDIVRTDALELLHEIRVRIQSPTDFLEEHRIYYNTFSSLAWLLQFNIFSHVPLDFSPISYTSLATLGSVPLRQLQSIARMVMLSGLFTEPEPNLIAHSPLSMAFATNSGLRDWADFYIRTGPPGAQGMAIATERWGSTDSTTQTPYNAFTGTTMSFFDHISQVPGMAEMFGRYMGIQALSPATRLEHLLNGFDWQGLKEDAHIVDVGGAHGAVSVALATAYPKFSFTIQDRPSGLGSSSKLPVSVVSRIRFIAHDFFEPQPPTHAEYPQPDIYLVRKILHDWPSSRARKILSNLAVALRDGQKSSARIIVMDTILPRHGTLPALHEAKMRARDLTMWQLLNSCERSLEEWNELFESVVPKLKLLSWKQPNGSVLAVMEVGLDHN